MPNLSQVRLYSNKRQNNALKLMMKQTRSDCNNNNENIILIEFQFVNYYTL